jgi:hypothetical protein
MTGALTFSMFSDLNASPTPRSTTLEQSRLCDDHAVANVQLVLYVCFTLDSSPNLEDFIVALPFPLPSAEAW